MSTTLRSASPGAAGDPASIKARTDALRHFTAAMHAFKHQMHRHSKADPDALAPLHFKVLRHCASQPGANQQTLVEASGRDKGQIARLVKDLAERGMLVREPDPNDGRVSRLVVTAEGAAATGRFDDTEAAVGATLLAPLSDDEVATLSTLLQKVVAAHAAAGHTPHGESGGRPGHGHGHAHGLGRGHRGRHRGG